VSGEGRGRFETAGSIAETDQKRTSRDGDGFRELADKQKAPYF